MNKHCGNWLENNGFNEIGNTYIVSGETYSIKDKLKKDGFIYHPILGWHTSKTKEGYEDRLVKINKDQILTLTKWGEVFFFPEAKKIIDAAVGSSPNLSEWIGKIGERVPALRVRYIGKNNFNSKFGLQYVYHFLDLNNNELIWFSPSFLTAKIGDEFSISMRIKDHKWFKNKKQTIITRVKIIESEK